MKKIEIYEGTKFYPAVAALEVTLACNMRCIHCGSSADGMTRANELNLIQWKKVVDDLVDLGTEYFTLSGGEPFVWRHWRELCSYIRSKDRTLSIVSNGYRITDDDVAFLESIGMWNIGLSVDGLKDVHDYIRRMPGSFDKVMKVIEKFKRTNVKVVVSTSVNRKNFNELELLREHLAQSDVDLWQVQVVNQFGRAGEAKDELIISQEQYVQLVKFVKEAQERQEEGLYKMRVMPADSLGYCHGIAAKIWGDMEWCGCNAGRYVIGIESNGNVMGCLSLQRAAFVAGNLLKRGLKEIWADDNSFAYNRKFDVQQLKGACANCESGKDCRGGCLAMGYSTSGELYNNKYCYKHITGEQSHAD